MFLGSEQWLRSMRQKIDVKWRHADIPLDQRAAGRPSMGAIINAVAEAMQVRPKEIRRGRGGLARMIAAGLGVYEGRRRLRVIARTLHLKSCNRITQLAAECEKLLRDDKRLEQFVAAARLAWRSGDRSIHEKLPSQLAELARFAVRLRFQHVCDGIFSES